MNKPSVRFTVSRHNSYGDIRELVACLGELGGGRPIVGEKPETEQAMVS
jgi:hypothetical protein